MTGDQVPERVLVFGDDMRIFLAVVRSLGRAGKEVHAAPFNWHAPALKSKYVSAVHHLPRYQENPAAWREAVLELLDEHAFDLIVPCCDDRSILPFHTHRDDFGRYPVVIPAASAMDLLFDKERTRELCAVLSIPTAKGRPLAARDTADALAAEFGLPLVLKPRRSYAMDRLDAWGKVWIVDTMPELRNLLGTIGDPSRYLAESWFEGSGVGVSVLAEDGRILHVFQHRRLREGRGGSSSYRVSETVDSELLDACQKILTHTKLTGVCMFEFRYNPKTQGWILIETNARFWGSMSLPLSLGVDFPLYLYDLLTKGAQHAPVAYQPGIRSRNLVLDGFNLVTSLRDIRRSGVGAWFADVGDYLTQPVRWISGRERSDSFVKDDIRPGLSECGQLFEDLGQKMARNRSPQQRRAEQRLGCHSARRSEQA